MESVVNKISTKHNLKILDLNSIVSKYGRNNDIDSYENYGSDLELKNKKCLHKQADHKFSKKNLKSEEKEVIY